MDEMYLDNIDEFVNDHNKIVTYKWLSLTLGVHVNLAKQMLFHYLEQKRRESSAPLHATYLVSGKFVENGQASHKVSVVREDQLEDVKSKLSLIVSVHVYSVQKAELKDSGPLYSVDYDAVKDNIKNCSRYSAISCASAVPMETPERAQAPPPDTKQEVTSVMNGQTSVPAKPTSKPKGIMGMFENKNAPKTQEKEIKSEKKENIPADVPAIESSKNKPVSKTNTMSNFFGKQTAKKPVEPVKQEAAEPSIAERKPTSPPATRLTQLDVEAPEDVLEKEHGSKTKRLNYSDGEEEKTESQKKKRRRIKKPQPDSSDEEVIPDSPRQQDVRKPLSNRECEVKREPVSSHNEKSPKKRKRRRVLKAHTFMDEEGCIVTEKAFESESYSETEDEFQASKPTSAPATLATGKREEKKIQKKSTSIANKGSKQASIMGFFQKK